MHVLRLLLIVAMICALAPSLPAACDCCSSCPECGNRTCHAVPVTTSVTKICYEVERRQICIPQVCFPWHLLSSHSLLGKLCGGCADADCTSSDDQCNNIRCGRVITVKVLKKVSYTCDSCGYAWEMDDAGCTDADTSAQAATLRPPQMATVERYQPVPGQTSTIIFR
ncbi:MAG: hypothetical protein CMJ81_08545 [Planctomycetaceae bacterium]|nr:hypothetical protein [Planctomycetaceae bacterium]